MTLELLSIFGIGLLLAALWTGWGALVARVLLRDPEPQAWACFWLGWSTWLGVLQLVHFSWPLSAPWIDFALLVAGAAGGALDGASFGRQLLSGLRAHPWAWTIATIGLLWLCNRSLGPLLTIDAGLYHLTSIKWAAEHPLVGGLANVHGRLAFNSSAFLWLASLDGATGALRAFHFAPSLLVAMAAADRFRRVLAARDPFERDFNALLMLPLGYAAAVMHVSSTSPDWIVLVVGVVLASTLSDLFTTHDPEERRRATLTIVALCAAGTTVKLSFAPLGVAILAVVAMRIARARGSDTRSIIPAFVLLAVLLVPWSLRSIELSGYPAYPSTAFATNVSWRVPEDRVEAEVRWIRSWARAPGRSPEEVLGHSDWIGPWLRARLSNADSLALLVFPLALISVAWVRRVRPFPVLPLLAPYVLATLVWFATAPDPRFLGATLWVCACALAAGEAKPGALGRFTAIGRAGCAIGFAAFALYMAHALGGLWIAPGGANGHYPLRAVDTREFRTHSGLLLHVPRKGDQCWEAPLPCTPYPAPRLGLRREGDLWSGFELKSLQ